MGDPAQAGPEQYSFALSFNPASGTRDATFGTGGLTSIDLGGHYTPPDALFSTVFDTAGGGTDVFAYAVSQSGINDISLFVQPVTGTGEWKSQGSVLCGIRFVASTTAAAPIKVFRLPNGDLFVVGFAIGTIANPNAGADVSLITARLLPTGSGFDPAFGIAGKTQVPLNLNSGSSNYELSGVVLESDGSTGVTGEIMPLPTASNPSTANQGAFYRFDAAGSLQSSDPSNGGSSQSYNINPSDPPPKGHPGAVHLAVLHI